MAALGHQVYPNVPTPMGASNQQVNITNDQQHQAEVRKLNAQNSQLIAHNRQLRDELDAEKAAVNTLKKESAVKDEVIKQLNVKLENANLAPAEPLVKQEKDLADEKNAEIAQLKADKAEVAIQLAAEKVAVNTLKVELANKDEVIDHLNAELEKMKNKLEAKQEEECEGCNNLMADLTKELGTNEQLRDLLNQYRVPKKESADGSTQPEATGNDARRLEVAQELLAAKEDQLVQQNQTIKQNKKELKEYRHKLTTANSQVKLLGNKLTNANSRIKELKRENNKLGIYLSDMRVS